MLTVFVIDKSGAKEEEARNRFGAQSYTYGKKELSKEEKVNKITEAVMLHLFKELTSKLLAFPVNQPIFSFKDEKTLFSSASRSQNENIQPSSDLKQNETHNTKQDSAASLPETTNTKIADGGGSSQMLKLSDLIENRDNFSTGGFSSGLTAHPIQEQIEYEQEEYNEDSGPAQKDINLRNSNSFSSRI